MREHGRRHCSLREGLDHQGLFQMFLDPQNRPGPQICEAGGGDHGGDREQGRWRRGDQQDRGPPEGRERALPQDRDGGDREDRGGPGSGRHQLESGGEADGRHAVRLPGAHQRRLRSDNKRLRHDRERFGLPLQGVDSLYLWNDPVEAEQQVPEGPDAGRGPGHQDRPGDEDLWRGHAHGEDGRGALRVPGRGVSRGTGECAGRTQGHRKRHWNDQDDSAH